MRLILLVAVLGIADPALALQDAHLAPAPRVVGFKCTNPQTQQAFVRHSMEFDSLVRSGFVAPPASPREFAEAFNKMNQNLGSCQVILRQ